MPVFATMLHVSDLHFVENFEEKKKRYSHDRNLAKSLAVTVQKLKRELEGIGGLDLLIGTGDISTDGKNGALKTAQAFIDTDRVSSGTHALGAGLSMHSNRRLIVPGNHDRYKHVVGPLGFQGHSTRLEHVFQTTKNYPYARWYNRDVAGATAVAAPLLVFFVLDSTPSPYTLRSLRNPIEAFMKKPAFGKLEDGDLTLLEQVSDGILHGDPITGLNGIQLPVTDYAKSIRIAVLHHHPIVIEAPRDWLERQWNRFELTKLENDNGFINSCFRAGIQIVLFGHEHIQFYKCLPPDGRVPKNVFGEAPQAIHFFCCPSTLARNARNQGFYLFSFAENAFQVRFFQWDGANFVEPNETVSFKRKNGALVKDTEKWPKVLPYGKCDADSGP